MSLDDLQSSPVSFNLVHFYTPEKSDPPFAEDYEILLAQGRRGRTGLLLSSGMPAPDIFMVAKVQVLARYRATGECQVLNPIRRVLPQTFVDRLPAMFQVEIATSNLH